MEKHESGRILYIDALRGFIIFLVVYHHALYKCFNGGSIFDMAALNVRMPIFFLVSGLLAYKPLEYWTRENTAKQLVKKVRQLIIPTVLFYIAYYYVTPGTDPFSNFIEHGWLHYWFTPTLFEFFVIVLLVNYLTRHNGMVNAICLILATTVCVVMCDDGVLPPKLYLHIQGYNVRAYMPFFVLGIFVRKHYDCVIKVMGNWWVVMGLMTIFVVLTVLQMRHPGNLVVIASRFAGAMGIFALFATVRDSFTATSRISRCITHVGRRTLDIYLIHFFFILPLPLINTYIYSHIPSMPPFVYVLTYSVVVTLLSLAVSALLRKNKPLGRLLFNAQYDN